MTICTEGRKNLFWNVGTDGHVSPVGATCGRPPLSDVGMMVEHEINRINGIYPNVSIGKYAVMPNHIHMIILIDNAACGRPQVAPTISRIIQQFKGIISKKAGFTVWQRSFHDRIIRSETEYAEVWQYIDTNPLKWETDAYYTS